MSGLKEIRRRISSVKNTKQITRAMKLVSAAKLRKAQEAAVGGRDFATRLEEVLEQVTQNLPKNYSNPLLEEPENKEVVRIVFIGGERGLCGAFNTNLLKAVNAYTSEQKLEYVPIGRRAVAFAKAREWKTVSEYEGLSEDAGKWPIAEIIEQQVNDFLEGKVQEVILFYTQFKSAMTQVVKTEKLLPFKLDQKHTAVKVEATEETEQEEDNREFKFDSPSEVIVFEMIPLLINTKLTQAALESKASEHASRMTAMDSATRNADDLIDKLKLYYNRARQSAITTELIDIVGGAEAAQG